MAFIIDSSESTYPSFFVEIKRYIAHVVEALHVSSDPKTSVHHARVSVIQQAPYEFINNKTGLPIHVDIGLTEHTSAQDIIRFLSEKTEQLEGGRALASAIESTVEQVFETAPLQRDRKVIVLFVTGTVQQEEERLVRIANELKCRGYFLVIFGVGELVGPRDAYVLSRMASEPSDVFFKRLDLASHFYDKHIQTFGQLFAKYISCEFNPENNNHRFNSSICFTIISVLLHQVLFHKIVVSAFKLKSHLNSLKTASGSKETSHLKAPAHLHTTRSKFC